MPIGGSVPREDMHENKKLLSRREITAFPFEAASQKRATCTNEFKRTAVARLHLREQSAT